MNLTAHDDWFILRSLDAVCDEGRDVDATHFDLRYGVVRYDAARFVIRYEAAWWRRAQPVFTPPTYGHWWRFSRKHRCWVFIGHKRPPALTPVF